MNNGNYQAILWINWYNELIGYFKFNVWSNFIWHAEELQSLYQTRTESHKNMNSVVG